MRTKIIGWLIQLAFWLVKSPATAEAIHKLLPKDFKYQVYGRVIRDFITRTDIDSESELDLLYESLYTIKYGYCNSIRVCAAYLDKDFGCNTFTNKVNDVIGIENKQTFTNNKEILD